MISQTNCCGLEKGGKLMIREVNIKINKVFQLGQIFVNKRLKQYGLRSGLFYFILELTNQDSMTMQDLSRAVNVDNGYTTRMINKLVELEYVEKVLNPSDSRSSIVFLTAKGKEISETVKQVMLDWVNIITKEITTSDIQIVNAVFDRLYINAKNYLDDNTKVSES